MAGIAYQIRAGALEAKSGEATGACNLLSLSTDIGMGGVGRAALTVSPGAPAPPPGAPVTVTLGDRRVFTGAVVSTRATPDALHIDAVDALGRLARADVVGSHEGKRAGAIVREILQHAGASAGVVEDGPSLASFVLHRGPRALRHVERLAEASGFDVHADGEGKVHFAGPRSGRADRTFAYGEQVVAIELSTSMPAYDGVVVWGEGAAGAKGAERAHWLVTDLSSVRGKAALDGAGGVRPGSAGATPLEVRDGAVRSAADAADQAEARVKALAARATRGFVEVLGDAATGPGDLVSIGGVPAAHPVHDLATRGALRVRRVRHTLSAQRGFVTRVEI